MYTAQTWTPHCKHNLPLNPFSASSTLLSCTKVLGDSSFSAGLQVTSTISYKCKFFLFKIFGCIGRLLMELCTKVCVECKTVQPLQECNFLNTRYLITSGSTAIVYMHMCPLLKLFLYLFWV